MQKERPILFNGEMVRAILEGRKTQTRRGITKLTPSKPQFKGLGYEKILHFNRSDTYGYDWTFCASSGWNDLSHAELMGMCPYGRVGDRLWVRETFAYELDEPDGKETGNFLYRASTPDIHGKWTSSIFMPRAASRILLEITNIRVQPLQDITDSDAIDEGMLTLSPEWRKKAFPEYHKTLETVKNRNFGLAIQGGQLEKPPLGQSPREVYLRYWGDINGKHSHLKNPWVWVIEFKRVQP
jgi:hypothetical protein